MGKVVLAFTDTENLYQFLACYYDAIGPDRELAMLEIRASSLSEAMEKLKEDGWGWSADTIFVTNGEEAFEQLMAPIRESLAEPVVEGPPGLLKVRRL